MSNVPTLETLSEKELVVINKTIVKKALVRSAIVVTALGVVAVGATFLSRHFAEEGTDTTPSE